jgi:3-phenylpropionate/trans-cinnamate dioxygenase ferredoxin subunit
VTATAATRARHRVCRLDELEPGRPRIETIGGRQIGIIRTEDGIYAIRNVCPHQGAELCRGTLGSTMLPSEPYEYRLGLEGHVMRCPWHGWEFDITSGRSLFDPDGVRVRNYPVTVEDGAVIVELR